MHMMYVSNTTDAPASSPMYPGSPSAPNATNQEYSYSPTDIVAQPQPVLSMQASSGPVGLTYYDASGQHQLASPSAPPPPMSGAWYVPAPPMMMMVVVAQQQQQQPNNVVMVHMSSPSSPESCIVNADQYPEPPPSSSSSVNYECACCCGDGDDDDFCRCETCSACADAVIGFFEDKRECMQVCALVMSCIFGLITMIMAIIAFKEINGYTHAFNDLVNNWQSSPLIDVQVVRDFQACPYGFDDHRLEWPGIFSACECSTKRPGTNSTSSDTNICGFQQRNDGCYSRYSRYDAQTVDLIPGFKLCSQRAGSSFLHQEVGVVVNDDSARSGSRIACSDPTTLRLCANICWPKSLACPLAHVEFSGSALQSNTSAYDEVRSFPGAPGLRFFLRRLLTAAAVAVTGHTARAVVVVDAEAVDTDAVPRSLGYDVHVFRSARSLDAANISSSDGAANVTLALNDTGSVASRLSLDPTLPLVEFHVSRGDICLLTGCGYDRSWAGDEYSYKFLHPFEGYKLRSWDCDGGCLDPGSSLALSTDGSRDPRYSTVAQNNERSVYQAYPNDIPSTFWPDASDNYMLTLNTRPRIPWTATCPIAPAKLVNQSAAVMRIRNCQLAAMVLAIIFFVWGLVMACILGASGFDKDVMNAPPFQLAAWVPRIGSFAIFLVTLLLAAKEYGFWLDLQGMATPCTDPVTTKLLSGLADILHKLAPPNIANLALSSMLVAWHTLENVCCRCNILTLALSAFRCCVSHAGNVLGCARHIGTCCHHCGPQLVKVGCTCCLRTTVAAVGVAKHAHATL